MSDLIITTGGLSKVYGRGAKRVEAAHGIHLEVQPAEIFGLVGPDGAGKTAEIQMLTGILAPSAGTATVARVDIVRNADAIGGAIGYMSEGFTLHGSLSVRENLDFFADLYRAPLAQREQRISDLLRFARLDHAVDRRAQHLSGGMKKKLALASDCTGLSRY